MTSLDGFHANIAGRRGHRRIRRRMRKRLDDVLVITEAYSARPKLRKWAVRHGYELRQPNIVEYGPEGPDVAILVRDDIEITSRDIAKMTEPWWGPFNYPSSRKQPRVMQTLGLRKAGVDFDLMGVHFPSGGPTGGVATRGKNAAAWHECADHVRHNLANTACGAALGDFNARRLDVIEHATPDNGRVVMASNVDGVAAVGCQISVTRLRSPLGMHGWFTTRITPKESR